MIVILRAGLFPLCLLWVPELGVLWVLWVLLYIFVLQYMLVRREKQEV